MFSLNGFALFKRRRELSIKQRLKTDALRLREQAKLLPPGAAREGVLRKARQVEAASGIDLWLHSPGLRPPK